MNRVFKNETVKLETVVLDDNGDFVSGLTVTYEIRKCLDDSVVASGTMTEVNSVYIATYTFDAIGEYRVKYVTPATYENGFENVIVDEYTNYKPDITDLSLKTSEIHQLQGLNQAAALVVNRTSRTAGSISQAITSNDSQAILQRIA